MMRAWVSHKPVEVSSAIIHHKIMNESGDGARLTSDGCAKLSKKVGGLPNLWH